MQHRQDYVEFERSPSKSALRTAGAAAEADDDGNAGAACVVPLLLGRTGQHVPVSGETAQVEAHEVGSGDEGGSDWCIILLFIILRQLVPGGYMPLLCTHAVHAAGDAEAGR